MGKPNWQNQTIWTGDNLDIMRGMNSESVDLIYLDPPFNSKHDYAAPIGSKAAGAAFKDTWGLEDVNLAWHGQIKHEHPGLYDLLNATRLIHGDSMMSYLIYMSVRIIEMRRLLKPTSALYLHCDPTAGHYLKLLMDSIFGKDLFRNEIVWRRTGSHNSADRFGPIHDVIFFYARSSEYKHKPVFTPYLNGHVETYFKKTDERGQYWTNSIHGSGIRYGESGKPWRGYDPTSVGRHWAIPSELVLEFGIDPKLPQHEKLEALYELGLIDLPKNSRQSLPTYRQYLSSSPGQLLQDIWAYQPHTKGCLYRTQDGIDEDVRWIPERDTKERTKYPTQKPLALIRRILEASSKPGDVVLDPFCGCATTCVAAEQKQRQWIGIDISPKAADLIKSRMYDELALFYHGTHRTDMPQRTDLGKIKAYNSVENKKYLYGEQGGYCNGCESHFELRHLHIDHIVPQAKGGTDHISNLQLLCGACNSLKGTKSHDELLVLLTDKGWIKRKQRVTKA